MDETTDVLGGDEPDVPSKWNFSVDVATSWERALFASPVAFTPGRPQNSSDLFWLRTQIYF